MSTCILHITTLQRPPSPPFRCGHIHRTKTACLRSLRGRPQPPAIYPVCLAHCAAAVPTLTAFRPKPTAKAVGYEPTLRSFRSTVTPKSQPHLHSAYQNPSASCRPNITSALGRYSDELPLMYGGGTFEIKRCYVVNNITPLMLPKQLCCVKDVTSCK